MFPHTKSGHWRTEIRAEATPENAQHPVKHSAKATAPKISRGFKLGRLPPDR